MTGENWKVIDSEVVIEHPHVEVAIETISLPDGRVINDWPIVNAHDYVNAVVFDNAGRALILEGYKHGVRRSTWQVVGGYLQPGEDPLATAQRNLLQGAGYESDDWRYLGSFVTEANRHVGVGHFFLCLNVRRVAAPLPDELEPFSLRWVTKQELHYALLDGRINIINYAMAISLGLMALHKLSQNQALAYIAAHRNKLDAS
ncbi:MAG TPA: NUDIX hydrolase [Candidatus Binatia bacterium]|jgi:8-oxo-dGTP pyrophosphatase MutT (NUDIX family)|nr:NUDIX hydrolase [Candidatus Binatia bacterium]